MKIGKYIWAVFMLLLCACDETEPGGGSEGGSTDNDIITEEQVPDPEETRTVSLYKADGHSISGIYVNDADKLTSNNDWQFVDLGEIKGLGNVISIPKDGWNETANVKLNHGYVAYNFDYGFLSLFVSNQATDEMGTITGYQFKYLEDFSGRDEIPSFDVSEIGVGAGGGSVFVSQTNGTVIPFTAESDADWLTIIPVPYVGIEEGAGFYAVAQSSNSLEDATATITVTSSFGKETAISFTRAALEPMKATISIKDLKLKYQSSNYCSATQIPDNTIIRGRVVSSDFAGNVYKMLTVDDGTAAISMCINQLSLYTVFPYGADVAFDLSGLYIGNYYGLMNVGALYEINGEPSISYCPFDMIKDWQVIGEPDPTKVTPKETSLPILDQALRDVADYTLWQSRFVTINDLEFLTPDTALASYHDSGYNQMLRDENGLTVTLRTSGYATFYNTKVPKGVGSITGLLSYYKGAWQIVLNDASGIGSFDPSKTFETTLPEEPQEPSVVTGGDGSFDFPFTVAQVIALGNPDYSAWVEGTISGVIDYNTIQPVYGATNSTTHFFITDSKDNWIAVQLPAGDIRTALNLQENPGYLGRTIRVYGALQKYYAKPGVKATSMFYFPE